LDNLRPPIAPDHARIHAVKLVVKLSCLFCATQIMTAADPSAVRAVAAAYPSAILDQARPERQLTHHRGGHMLTNTGVWSPDGEWIVYDTRSDPAGSVFDGTTIELVNVRTLETRVLYRSTRGAGCGVATFNPVRPEVVFIHGPEDPTPEWSYNAYHRRGVVVRLDQPQVARNLDARDLLPPFTPGALRGGSHVHVFSGDGEWVSFTYEDHVLARFTEPGPEYDLNQRNLGVSSPVRPVRVNPDHPRNHDGSHFTVIATRTVSMPKPGEFIRACEEGWVGTHGYVRADGTRQRRALAFQGHVLTGRGDVVAEVFIVDLPEDLTVPGDGPIAGTERRMPFPPKGAAQRRLTHTEHRKCPGIQGPRHWLRCSPDGEQIAFLMKDEGGIVQLWTVSPRGGEPVQRTRHPWDIASTFTWSPDGRRIAHVMDNSVFVTDLLDGVGTRLTARADEVDAPRPEACVFSPDGRQIAYVRRVPDGDTRFNQVFVVSLE
jgi:hypothetical protein